MTYKLILFLKLILLAMALVVAGILALLAFTFIVKPLTSEDGSFVLPILLGLFLSSIPYFVGLLQGLKILNLLQKSQAFSRQTLQALLQIKNMAFIVTAIYSLMAPFFYQFAQAEDAPGLIIIGTFPLIMSLIIGVFALVLKAVLEEGVQLAEEAQLIV